MFKLTVAIVVVAMIGLAVAVDHVDIINQENVLEPDGKFHYGFETADGTKVQQQGEPKTIGSEIGQSVSGSFAFSSPEGEKFDVQYTADENGYQPQGAHIHQVPELIVKAIKWAAEHPYKEKA